MKYTLKQQLLPWIYQIVKLLIYRMYTAGFGIIFCEKSQKAKFGYIHVRWIYPLTML
jgi:hypothetical protein